MEEDLMNLYAQQKKTIELVPASGELLTGVPSSALDRLPLDPPEGPVPRLPW